MKNLLCVIAVFLSWITVTSGQMQPGKTNIRPGMSPDQIVKSITQHPLKNGILNFPQERSELLSGKSLEWIFDTIIIYDSVGKTERITRSINTTSKIVTDLDQYWQSNSWTNYTRTTSSFDNGWNILNQLTEEWVSNAWVNYSFETYTYASNGNLTIWLYQTWASNAWVNSSRDSYTYDSGGNMLTDILEKWEVNAWVYDAKLTYTYDAHGNILTATIQSWQSNEWNNSIKWINTYNSSDQLLTTIVQFWQANSWGDFEKGIYSYNTNGYTSVILIQMWQTNAWMDFIKETFTYDAGNNLLVLLTEIRETSSWTYAYRHIYSYDGDGNSITGKYEEWSGNSWHPGESSLDIISQNETGYYVYGYRYEASFVSYVTGLTGIPLPGAELKIYPNPADDRITIERSSSEPGMMPTLVIFGSDGREMIRQPANSSHTDLDISHFSPGLYFINLIGDNGVEKGRFIRK